MVRESDENTSFDYNKYLTFFFDHGRLPLDYRKFLRQTPNLILPYFHGEYVFSQDRVFRLHQEHKNLQPGWWSFSVHGRVVTPQNQTTSPSLELLPKVIGHLLGSRLIEINSEPHPLFFLPEEEAPLFSPCQARRWHSGELIFETLLFETTAEEQVRNAFDQHTTLDSIKGIPASLRAAFSYQLAEVESQKLQIPASPLEIKPYLTKISQGGIAAATQVLHHLQTERNLYRQRQQEAQERQRQQEQLFRQQAEMLSRQQQVDATQERKPFHFHNRADGKRQNIENRIESALLSAGAGGFRTRSLGNNQMEVHYWFMDETFTTIIDATTLQVLDAGICLDGEDQLVTLESLPGVIREAIQNGELVITRHQRTRLDD